MIEFPKYMYKGKESKLVGDAKRNGRENPYSAKELASLAEEVKNLKKEGWTDSPATKE